MTKELNILPTISQQYRPTQSQWVKMITQTEFYTGDESILYSSVELVNFRTSKIHLKGGRRVSFDGISESQYLHICNGGYYEDAPIIDDTKRI